MVICTRLDREMIPFQMCVVMHTYSTGTSILVQGLVCCYCVVVYVLSVVLLEYIQYGTYRMGDGC